MIKTFHYYLPNVTLGIFYHQDGCFAFPPIVIKDENFSILRYIIQLLSLMVKISSIAV